MCIRDSLSGAGVNCLQPDLLEEVGLQSCDGQQLQLGRIETRHIETGSAVQHNRPAPAPVSYTHLAQPPSLAEGPLPVRITAPTSEDMRAWSSVR